MTPIPTYLAPRPAWGVAFAVPTKTQRNLRNQRQRKTVILQNKPNFRPFFHPSYALISCALTHLRKYLHFCRNPKTNPIQTQSNPILTRTNPIQSQNWATWAIWAGRISPPREELRGWWNAEGVEEGGGFCLDAFGGVEVHRGGPALPILAARFGIISRAPFVEAELDVRCTSGFYEVGQRGELSGGEAVSSGGDESGDVKAANERPDAAVVVFAGAVIFFIAWSPVGVGGSDVGEKTGRQIGCQLAALAKGATFSFYPVNQLACSCTRGDAREDCEAVAEQVESLTAIDFVGPHRVVGLEAEDEAFVDVAMQSFAFYGEVRHIFAEQVGAVFEAEQFEVDVCEGVDVEAVADDPLLVAPVGGGHLSD
jgi:hypothetical protein